nr:hypothetical protein [uncultured Rhodopila sp.]
MTAASFAAISSVDFDEAWYLSAYPDIKLGVESEQFESGLHHYQIQGYFEGRLPKEIEVDEDFYLENNPDVKRAITMGVIPGAELHFLTKGYKEGRIPSASYSFSRPELSEALRGVKARVSRELSDVQPVFAKQA